VRLEVARRDIDDEAIDLAAPASLQLGGDKLDMVAWYIRCAGIECRDRIQMLIYSHELKIGAHNERKVSARCDQSIETRI
jgi:hypothetical protein